LKRKIIIISRNYPPKIGGLESYSYNLIKEFEKHHHVIKIVLSKSIRHLIWFAPYSFIKSLNLAGSHSIRHIHLCDAVLAPIGLLLKLSLDVQVSVSVHGLDITYGHILYKSLIPRCVARLDRIISVSQATRSECQRRDIPLKNCTVIPNGIRSNEHYLAEARDDLRMELEKMTGCAVRNSKILATVGRLVKRKGVAWFIECVMPCLDSNYIYIVAGYGPEFDRIQRLVSRLGLEQRVLLLGRVSNATRKILLNAADIFIMPNITVANDVEGFGIVALEAGSCGLPVVASNIQGLKDAVTQGQNGYLVEEGDAAGFAKKIQSMDLDKEVVRKYVIARYSWEEIYLEYQNAIFD
jgi:phosphatidylinositol alpha-1,6-mannosyltransferase